MLVPIDWLRDYVHFDVSIEELSTALTMAGLNVENIIELGKDISKVVAGKIIAKDLHPNADKLYLCKVDIGGNDILQIITGADNINKGDIIPVALPGAELPGNKKIEATNLRGLTSQGMMCSPQELKLDLKKLTEDQQDGILILPDNSALGEDVKKILALDGIVMDIEITADRPDCMSIIGIAREVAAILGTNLKYPSIELPKGDGNINDWVRINVEDSTLCPRYTARLIDNIVIKSSPIWMQRRLQMSGLRPINNIVDITNYVMLELGQPLHAFDYDYLDGNKIVVRRAEKGEKIKTLDGTERSLDEEILVIADENKPVGIAGIMGGEDSEVTEKTKKIVMESAAFNYANIRRSSRKLGLRTEASARFEKGLDTTLAKLAGGRFVHLISQTESGNMINGVLDIYSEKTKLSKVTMNTNRVNKQLGTNISVTDMENILNRLELRVINKDKNNLVVEIPSFRSDISHESDLSEEIGRIYGFDKIEPTLPKGITTLGKINRDQTAVNKAKEVLNGCGLSEVITYSFISPKVFSKINIPDNHEYRKAVSIMNPLGEDYSLMRTTIIGNLMEVIERNLNRKVGRIRLFELGSIYKPKNLPLEGLPDEKKVLTLAMVGDVDFYDMKGIIETLLGEFNIKLFDIIEDHHPSFHPGRTAALIVNNKKVGILGEVHPDVTERYEIDERVYISEIQFDDIIRLAKYFYSYKPLPKFPSVKRDIAIIIDDKILAGDIKKTIESEGGSILENVELFDIYKGVQVPMGCKSLAFSITYRSGEKTLLEEDVNEVQRRILLKLKEKYNANLR